MSEFTKGKWGLTTREGKPESELDGSESICVVVVEGAITSYIASLAASGHYEKKLANARLIAAARQNCMRRAS